MIGRNEPYATYSCQENRPRKYVGAQFLHKYAGGRAPIRFALHFVKINVVCSDPESDKHKERYYIADSCNFIAINLLEFGRAAPEQKGQGSYVISTSIGRVSLV